MHHPLMSRIGPSGDQRRSRSRSLSQATDAPPLELPPDDSGYAELLIEGSGDDRRVVWTDPKPPPIDFIENCANRGIKLMVPVSLAISTCLGVV